MSGVRTVSDFTRPDGDDAARGAAEESTVLRRANLGSQRASFHLVREREVAGPVSLC